MDKLNKKIDYRNEKKFRVTELSYSEIRNIVHFSPFLFKEIYYQRTVNNFYLLYFYVYKHWFFYRYYYTGFVHIRPHGLLHIPLEN